MHPSPASQSHHSIQHQIRLLASFRHPRIVRVHEAFLDGTPLHLCVVMEYCGFQVR